MVSVHNYLIERFTKAGWELTSDELYGNAFSLTFTSGGVQGKVNTHFGLNLIYYNGTIECYSTYRKFNLHDNQSQDYHFPSINIYHKSSPKPHQEPKLFTGPQVLFDMAPIYNKLFDTLFNAGLYQKKCRAPHIH